MFCLVFLVRIFYPTKIRTSYFARIFYPTKIRASYSVRIIFIRRILERSRFRPARISSVYVVPGTVSHVLPTFSILGALRRTRSAPLELLRSPRRLPVAGSDYSLHAISDRERLNPRTQIDVARHTSGGRRAETRSAETAFGQCQRHCSPVDVDGTAEERAKDVVVRGVKPHTFVGMLREAVDDQVRPASDG